MFCCFSNQLPPIDYLLSLNLYLLRFLASTLLIASCSLSSVPLAVTEFRFALIFYLLTLSSISSVVSQSSYACSAVFIFLKMLNNYFTNI